jgi:hypothetical protein
MKLIFLMLGFSSVGRSASVGNGNGSTEKLGRGSSDNRSPQARATHTSVALARAGSHTTPGSHSRATRTGVAHAPQRAAHARGARVVARQGKDTHAASPGGDARGQDACQSSGARFDGTVESGHGTCTYIVWIIIFYYIF